MSGNSSPLEEKAKNQHPPVDSTKQGDTQIAKAQLTKFPEPKSKPKEREEIKKIIKDDSDEEKEEESEDYTPSDENDVSIEADGENTSEHSDSSEFDLEGYLKYCETHSLKESEEENGDENEEGNLSRGKKKLKKNEEEDDDVMIISSKDIKNKKSSKK